MSWKLSRTVLRGAVGGNADCLLDARVDGKPKQPFAFNVTGSSLFAFAGLWDAWKDGHGDWLQSFSILTTTANELLSAVHSRMPVILHPRDYDRWLSRETAEQPPTDLLRPFESEDMEMHPANPLVGNVRNNGPEMLKQPLAGLLHPPMSHHAKGIHVDIERNLFAAAFTRRRTDHAPQPLQTIERGSNDHGHIDRSTTKRFDDAGRR